MKPWGSHYEFNALASLHDPYARTPNDAHLPRAR